MKLHNEGADVPKSDNELIAEFMGHVPSNNFGPPCIFTGKNTLSGWEFLQFDTSWDWLMPVVEKIEARERTLINIYGDGTKIWVDDKDGNELFATTQHGNKDHKIGHVYRAVVEFIKWFETREERRNETSV